MLPGKTATKKAAALPPTTARAGCFHVPNRAAPRASSTMPETTTTESGSAGNHDGTCAWNYWRCFVRCPVPAASSAAPSASWPMAPRVRRVLEFGAIDGPPCRRDRQPVHGLPATSWSTSASPVVGSDRELPTRDRSTHSGGQLAKWWCSPTASLPVRLHPGVLGRPAGSPQPRPDRFPSLVCSMVVVQGTST
jgi:hypothetical protein